MDELKKVILLIKPEGAYDRRLLKGIARYTQVHTKWSIFHEVEENKRALHFVKTWGAQGVIADFREAEKIRRILPAIPLITVGANRIDPVIPNVASNAEAIAQMAFHHFKERGFKQFAFGGYNDLKWANDRQSSFERILHATAFSYDRFLSRYMTTKRNWEKELNLLTAWVVSLPKPAAILGCNDEYGRHIIEACKLAKIHIPQEVAVVGVDNDDIICDLCSPPLSSVSINTEAAGYKAAELLDRLIEGEKMEGQTIVAEPTEVITRGSSDILSIEDPEINRIIEYIHNRSNHLLDVGEIAEYSCKSRRALYNSFIKATGISVSKYLQNHQIEQISSMLLKTDLSIHQIAEQLGYSGTEKVSRFFRKVKGVTPSDYRRKLGKIRI